MPHIVVEYSDNLSEAAEQAQLIRTLHQTVVDSGLFSPEAVKARAIVYQDYVLPEGAQHFMHITVSILSGRPVEQRQLLSADVFNRVRELVSPIDKLSVDIHEMNKETYRK